MDLPKKYLGDMWDGSGWVFVVSLIANTLGLALLIWGFARHVKNRRLTQV